MRKLTNLKVVTFCDHLHIQFFLKVMVDSVNCRRSTCIKLPRRRASGNQTQSSRPPSSFGVDASECEGGLKGNNLNRYANERHERQPHQSSNEHGNT